MISKVMTLLSNDLSQFLKNRFNLNEDPVILANITGIDGSVAIDGENKIVLTLVNIEQETALPNTLNTHPGSGSTTIATAPSIFVNLYILASAFFKNSNYNESLKLLSATISFFQQKPVFNHQNTPSLGITLGRFTIEMYNMGITAQSNLWSQLGGKYLPSVLYKLRMLTFNENYPVEIIDNVTTSQSAAGKL
jgi:Pvc16 N-terminal domain